MRFNVKDLTWTREPEDYSISEERIEITTKPFTDLWQRTYYHFRNDNAPVLQMETEEAYLPYVERKGENPVRYICVQSGGFLF